MALVNIIFLNHYNKDNFLTGLRDKQNLDLWCQEEEKVRKIIQRVKAEGDQGLVDLTQKFDCNQLTCSDLAVKCTEIKSAEKRIDPQIFQIIKASIERIKHFHQLQREKSWFSLEEPGMILGQIVQPLNRVGVYVPGGTAEYPSSLIMGAVPALVAGVKEIVIVTPLGKRSAISPYILKTADALGITEIYKVGGAQAIAALAYGTETIAKVDKIVGPGNIYVTLAKKQVFGQVDIDMLAGPSEILIWADESAKPDYIVADLFSQAEHDKHASAIFITTSEALAREVQQKMEDLVTGLERESIIRQSLKENGKIIVAEDQKIIIDYINAFAPEHLELQLNNPWSYLNELKNFGAVFLGPYSPEPLGDYWAGPNHILPTMGNARQFSVLSVHDFLKRSSIIQCQKDKLLQHKKDIVRFAQLEGLTAHARAIDIRQ